MPLNSLQIAGRLGSDPTFFVGGKKEKNLARFDVKLIRWGRPSGKDEDWIPVLCAEHVAKRIKEGKPDCKVGDLVTIYGSLISRNERVELPNGEESGLVIKRVSVFCVELYLTYPGEKHEARYFEDEELIAGQPPI